MKTRQTIIDQIKAMMLRTTENGCSEAEAMEALAKASAMRDAYVVTDEELALSKEESAILHSDAPDLADPHGIKWRLAFAVNRYCGVRIYRKRGRKLHEGGLRAIGLRSDVDYAMWLLDHLADFIQNQLTLYLNTLCAPKSERRIAIRSYVEGITSRINVRLIELTERSDSAATSNSRELVVVRGAAIKAYMDLHGIHIRKSRRLRSGNVDEDARAAGRAAGDRASFGRPVTGTAGMQRIGKA